MIEQVLQVGDEVEFTYHGSQEINGQRVKGVVSEMVPRVSWSHPVENGACGGSVLIDGAGYATDVVVTQAEQPA